MSATSGLSVMQACRAAAILQAPVKRLGKEAVRSMRPSASFVFKYEWLFVPVNSNNVSQCAKLFALLS